MLIGYTAPAHVRDTLEVLGRTEDVRFSPDNRRLAVLGFHKNVIAVFDIDIATSPDGKVIRLTNVAEISSPHLNSPHGLDFIDNETVVVANRDGKVCVMSLLRDKYGNDSTDPHIACSSDFDLVFTPGSVSITRKDEHLHEVLICNNFKHDVTRHLLDTSKGYSVTRNEVLFRKWLKIPDGITVSPKKQWIAVSNHYDQSVFLYNNGPDLNGDSDPEGILLGVLYPHGLRFTSDERFLLVADAGTRYVHIYGDGTANWHGVRNPLLSVEIISEEDFRRGHNTPEEGGAKGIDIDNTMSILATTCECQPLAFFDLEAILKKAEIACSTPSTGDANGNATTDAWDVRYQLARLDKFKQLEARVAQTEAQLATIHQQAIRTDAKAQGLHKNIRGLNKDIKEAKAETKRAEARARRAEKQVLALENSKLWRLTAPLRRIMDGLKKLIERLKRASSG